MSVLDPPTRAALLRQAREAIAAELFGTPFSKSDSTPRTDLPTAGVFVTLRKNGQLRGCIGTFDDSRDLTDAVRTMAVSAARDPRFVHMPIGANEIGELAIEISVLSPLTRIDDPLDFEIGKHGIFIRREGAVGCFLPDVATERGWTREQFLTECCGQKAGLDPLAWREPATEVFVFTVEKVCDRPGPA